MECGARNIPGLESQSAMLLWPNHSWSLHAAQIGYMTSQVASMAEKALFNQQGELRTSSALPMKGGWTNITILVGSDPIHHPACLLEITG